MYVSMTGHFEEVKRLARECNADGISIQTYYTFCNFAKEADAKRFFTAIDAAGMETAHGINTHRPFVPFEVAVRHPK